MPVRVVTDSSCDLPDELVDELGIEIVPLTIRFGDEELVDRQELSAAEFWRRLESSPTLPETAAPSAGAFEAVFREAASGGADGIVCVNLSSKLSATMQSAQLAAKELDGVCPVTVIDSLQASMGVGNLVLAAARGAAAGNDLDTIAADVLSRRSRTKLFGTLDTLEYLRKGGRVGAAQALLGSMLSIKPVIELRDGEVAEAGKVRTRSKALQKLADEVNRQPVEEVAILHGNAPDLDELLDLVAPTVKRENVIIGTVGPVIGTHAGPRVIGVTFQTTT